MPKMGGSFARASHATELRHVRLPVSGEGTRRDARARLDEEDLRGLVYAVSRGDAVEGSSESAERLRLDVFADPTGRRSPNRATVAHDDPSGDARDRRGRRGVGADPKRRPQGKREARDGPRRAHGGYATFDHPASTKVPYSREGERGLVVTKDTST
jgi:hypothetical protein